MSGGYPNGSGAGGGLVLGLLGLLFVALKLLGVISWSWWWVLCPFWGPVLLAIVIISAILFAPIFSRNGGSR